jgi:hypothetical protein
MDTKYGLVSVLRTRVTPTFLPDGTAPDGRGAALDAAPEALLDPPAAEAPLEPPADEAAALVAAPAAEPAALVAAPAAEVAEPAALLLEDPHAAVATRKPAVATTEAARRPRGRKLLDIRSPFSKDRFVWSWHDVRRTEDDRGTRADRVIAGTATRAEKPEKRSRASLAVRLGLRLNVGPAPRKGLRKPFSVRLVTMQ